MILRSALGPLALLTLVACGSDDAGSAGVASSSGSSSGSTGAGGASASSSAANDVSSSASGVMTSSSSASGSGGAGGSPSENPFVTVCGTNLCEKGSPFVVHGATTYGQLSNPPATIALANQEKLNVLELVNFESTYEDLSTAMSESTWVPIDKMIAAAQMGGFHVILNLSGYGHSLQKAGMKPTTTDWKAYLTFITTRVNTVSNTLYRDDPTIAMVELYGEIDAPNNGAPLAGTTQETTDFFHRTLAEFKVLDANHLVGTGGFSYLNEANAAGIDWQTIMKDPNDDICAVEINSLPDRNVSVPMVTKFCQTLNKPWFLSAWSSCLADNAFNGDIDHWASDDQMATHATDMYAVANDEMPAAPAPAYAAIGSDFWNLGTKSQKPTCEIGPQFPKTMAVVIANGQ